MMIESVRALLRLHRPGGARRRLHQHNWMHGLPLKTRFRRSRLYISALLPIGLGFVVGIFSAILGIGGGFIMVPAMIYMLGMPTAVVPGTSLLQIIFVAANVTVLQAYTNHTVDAVLALVLLRRRRRRRAVRHPVRHAAARRAAAVSARADGAGGGGEAGLRYDGAPGRPVIDRLGAGMSCEGIGRLGGCCCSFSRCCWCTERRHGPKASSPISAAI